MPEITERRSNRAPWLALLFVLAAIGVNAAVFMGIPWPGLVPWLSLGLAGLAVVYAVIGLRRAFRRPQLYGGKITSSIFGVLALLMFGMVIFGQFHARDLPASAGAPHVGQKAPDFTLTDTHGNKVSLAELLGTPQNSGSGDSAQTTGSSAAGNPAAPKAVLLIFYRGYW